MAVKDRFFKLKLKLTDIKLKIKRAGPALCGKIRSVNSESIKHFLRGMIFGIKPLIFETPADLKNWNAKTAAGKIRYVLLFLLLCAIFAAAGSLYSFTANDAFISFRYVSNAVKGW